ncbi:MAG: radical SAM family heme chaperone HemW [Myxococcales bacterium]|nr:radical SAM family heme chaperone HemW [Myxococcales bacterium]
MGPDGRLGVYVHFPYCTRRCPYCDFTVTVRPVEHERYRDGVLAELAARAPAFAGRDPALSVYFGGGTPGLWSPAAVGAVVDGVARTLGLAADAEITVECNPEDVTLPQMAGLRAAGVNRISLGTQSFDDGLLAFLGRQHDAATNRRAVAAVQAAGFTRLSLDLMYGARDQPIAAAVADVRAAAALGPTHLSAYQLTVESGTPFGARERRGEELLGPEERLADAFEAVRAAAREEGIFPYEISNFARPGEEAVHNSLYWTHAEYLALGAGAHGFRKVPGGGGVRWENARALGAWFAGVFAGAPAESQSEALDAATLAEDRVMTGLRLDRGLAVDADLAARFGAAADRLAAQGLLAVSPGLWRVTDRGRLLLNRVVVSLLEDS